MKLPNHDLDKIGHVLLEFFKTKRTRDALNKFHEWGITGWEKWWQTEVAMFLGKSEELIAEWNMECYFDVDRRSRSPQKRMAIDIGFRLKNHAVNKWHYVELKQNDSYKTCINRMCKDAEKVFSARGSAIDGTKLRYIACAGVFRKIDDEDQVLDYATKALDDANIKNEGLYLEPVGDHYSVLVF